MLGMQELSALWDTIIDGLANGAANNVLADSILRYAFFWYNFMPLARGTAVVGYITILSMFLAAGMPVTSTIPKVRLLSCHASWMVVVCLLLPSESYLTDPVSACRGFRQIGRQYWLRQLTHSSPLFLRGFTLKRHGRQESQMLPLRIRQTQIRQTPSPIFQSCVTRSSLCVIGLKR